MEGRGADLVLAVEISATLDQQVDHLEVRGGSAGQVQRALPAAGPGLNVSPVREQQGGQRRVAVEGGAMQGSFALRISGPHVGSVRQEQARHGAASPAIEDGSCVQRSLALAVGRVRIRASFQEPAGQLRVVVEHRDVQGGQPARLIGGVDCVGVIADVLLDFRDLPPLLLGQSIAARGGAQQADEQEPDGSLADDFQGLD